MRPNSNTAVHFFLNHEKKTSLFRLWSNQFLTVLCVLFSLFTLVPLFSLLYLLIKKGLPLLHFSVFTKLPPPPGLHGGGFGNAIVGTITMVGIATLLSAPLGILGAIYISEYAPHSSLTATVRFIAKLLTGIPSIICGAFAFALVVLHTGEFSALAGGVALSILMLPTILLTSEQALIGVPSSYRDASYGLGATPFQTIWCIVLPEALPAMMMGMMLAVARAAGETAPVLFTALFSQQWASSIMEPTASLSVLIYNFSALPYHYQVQMAWTASLVLVAMVTGINILAQLLFRRKFQ
ncbi:MAG: phosphate ABC transporter permease PstA [Chthoniobacterales bacterium]|nr:phosphate ABC transporter permease PstA [Chthoniobacterales bacterium]